MGLYEQAPALVGGSKTKARENLQQIYRISQADGCLAEAALLQMQKRPLPEIEAYLRHAVQLNPRFYRALIDLTSILASDGYRHYTEAEHFARQAVTADPERAAAYGYLASVYAHQQRWSDLDAVLAEAQRRVPGNSAPLFSAAVALLESNTELPRAESYLRQYLTREPEAGAPTQSHRALEARSGPGKTGANGRRSQRTARRRRAERQRPGVQEGLQAHRGLKAEWLSDRQWRRRSGSRGNC